MKVAHVCRTFSKLSETFIYDVIIALAATEIENQVVAFKRENKADRPFSKVILLKPSNLLRFNKGIKKLLSAFKMYKYQAKAEQAADRNKMLYNYFVKERPDVIHAHFGLQGILVLPTALKLNIPLVVSFHGYDAFRLPNDPKKLQQLLALFQNAAAITVVSVYMKNHLEGLGCPASKIHLIHVGKQISNYKFKADKAKPIKNFLSIGRLSEKKGFPDCISAFSNLCNTYPGLKLTIVGAGELQQEISQLIAAKNLSDHITLAGSLSHQEVIKELATADAFILCSKTSADGDMEGIPTVLMEAMAIGLPCVSTRHSGIPEVFPESSQFLLANEGDVQDIASKIETLLNLPEAQIQQLKIDGRNLVEAKFNLQTETTKLKIVYYSLIKE